LVVHRFRHLNGDDVIEKLRKSGMKIGLLSNWDLGARDILDKIGITKYFDSIVISSEIGIEKPSKEAFSHSLNELRVNSEEAFYVGDNYFDDVKGGNKVGLKVFLINRTDKQSPYKEGDYVEINSLMEIFNVLN
jgi:putative hydrolase of the HAD superfamily